MGFRPWWKVLKKDITIYTFDHNFGIVVPCPSGFVWGQQTCGVMCHQVGVEGIFIPLPLGNDMQTILDDLSSANYSHKESMSRKYWKKMRASLKDWEHLEFKVVKAPKGMPVNQEGLLWIKITRWDSTIDERDHLVGEIVCLYYPNSD